jgi:homoserine dehydrogenase
MTTVIDAVRAHVHAPCAPTRTPLRIALLGVGQVGGALAALVRESPLAQRFHVSCGLVRDTERPRPGIAGLRLTASLGDPLGDRPDLVIEALGGLEPARTLVLSAIEQRIPVVTANKSLLAAHGEALLDAAARAGVPLRYEAAVLAGVPFLGTFARRSLARDITGLCGVVNGTTNFILTRMADDHSSFAAALADAQARGYAEPDPAHDVNGVDAAEKLCVLLRHFGDWSVTAGDLENNGIALVEAADLRAAAEFGGALKPIVCADWLDGTLSASAGPAFVFASHPLARVNGVQNAVLLRNRTAGDLFFAGPGAGPAVTAATLLDDAIEIADEAPGRAARPCASWKRADPVAPATGWFVRISGDALPEAADIADLFSAYGVWLRRSSEPAGPDRRQRWFLTYGCARPRMAAALRALSDAAGCRTFCVRILES